MQLNRPGGNWRRSRVMTARRGTLVTVGPADRKLDEFTTGNRTWVFVFVIAETRVIKPFRHATAGPLSFLLRTRIDWYNNHRYTALRVDNTSHAYSVKVRIHSQFRDIITSKLSTSKIVCFRALRM